MNNNMNYTFYTAGTSYRNVDNFVDSIGAMSNTEIENLSVKLVREPSNKYDEYAVKVLIKGTFCGYAPKSLSREISKAIKSGAVANANVVGVGLYGDIEINVDLTQATSQSDISETTKQNIQQGCLGIALAVIIVVVIAVMCS